MNQPRLLRAVEATSVLLFFLQALQVVFSVLLGIIYDQVFAGSPTAWLIVSLLLVIVALGAPMAGPLEWRRPLLGALACVAAVGRVALCLNDATIRYWACLIVLLAGGLYLEGLLVARRSMVLSALLGALSLDQFLRMLGQTYDMSLRPGWLPVQAAWAAVVVGVAVSLARRVGSADRHSSQLGGLAGLALGALLFLETSLLALPNAAARWGGIPYALLAPVMLAMTMVLLIPRARWQANQIISAMAAVRVGAAALLPTGLLVGYFAGGWLSAAGLTLAEAAGLVCLASLLDGQSPIRRRTGTMLAFGLLLLFVLNLLNAFAFTYPYAVPGMRGMGWAVFLVAGLSVGAGVLRVSPVRLSWNEVAARTVLIVPVGLIGLAAAIYAVWPRSADPLPQSGELHIATYNIHYGYDDVWHYTLEEIAQTLEANDVDVAALQEVDTGRLTSYGVDDAYYLARRLRMNVAYLPTVEHLTGIALLYRGSAARIDERLLASLQEPTGIVRVQLDVNGQPLNAYGIWMGLSDEDTQRQIREALDFVGDHSPAAFGGDFNAEEGSPVAQAVVQVGFADPFRLLGIDPPPLTDPAIHPTSRIDFVWLRGLEPVRAWVPESLASDHRMVVVEIQVGP